jgi:hypothetical protein
MLIMMNCGLKILSLHDMHGFNPKSDNKNGNNVAANPSKGNTA